MNFDLISDMHVDSWHVWAQVNGVAALVEQQFDFDRNRSSDTLIIAGDTANNPQLAWQTCVTAADVYDRVLFVDGNHDHYNSGALVGETIKLYTEMCKNFNANGTERIVFLPSHKGVVVGRTAIIGANGWYDWKATVGHTHEQQIGTWVSSMNDSRLIKFDQHSLPDKLANADAKTLTKRIAHFDADDNIDNIVIVTHTVPHRKLGLTPDHPWHFLEGSFVNTLMEQVAQTSSKIAVWCYGHSHFRKDCKLDNGIRYCNNARGYFGEQVKFHRRPQIDIDKLDVVKHIEVE